MAVVTVVFGSVLLGALIGGPGWLSLRLLHRLAPAAHALLPVERGYLALVLGIGIVGPVALVLAMLGHFSVPLLVVLILALCILAVLATRRIIPSPEETGMPMPSRAPYRDWGTLALAALLILAAVLFLRPGETLLGDGDAGVYYDTGVAIARTGGIVQHDATLAGIVGDAATTRHILQATPHWRYRFLDGIPHIGFFALGTTGDVMPQFMHLWGAWLAVFAGVFGVPGPAYAPPLCGLLGVAGVTLLGRRLFGWPVG